MKKVYAIMEHGLVLIEKGIYFSKEEAARTAIELAKEYAAERYWSYGRDYQIDIDENFGATVIAGRFMRTFAAISVDLHGEEEKGST